jgi:hypothetical protein
MTHELVYWTMTPAQRKTLVQIDRYQALSANDHHFMHIIAYGYYCLHNLTPTYASSINCVEVSRTAYKVYLRTPHEFYYERG